MVKGNTVCMSLLAVRWGLKVVKPIKEIRTRHRIKVFKVII